jgi:hypothetical protein
MRLTCTLSWSLLSMVFSIAAIVKTIISGPSGIWLKAVHGFQCGGNLKGWTIRIVALGLALCCVACCQWSLAWWQS